MEIYLDNAATSHPKPACVPQAVLRALTEDNANPGRSGHPAALRAGRTVLAAREALAALMNAEGPLTIAFCHNCTDALNLAIKGMLRKGDHLIVSQLDHNAVLRVAAGLARRGSVALTILPPRPDGFIDPGDVRAALRKNTRLIACTHASNVTGAIQPVAAIGAVARAAGVPFLVDGAQALGALPVDVRALGCDLYAFPGHKGLLGPQGTGGLYIRPGLTLAPLREGGTGTASERLEMPDEPPERYEAGTLNLPGIAGLGTGCAWVAPQVRQIMAHERELTAALLEGLAAIPGAAVYSPAEASARAGIACFNLGDLSSSQAADRLAELGFAVRGGLHCAPGAHRFLGTLDRGAIRASVGHANTHDEIEAFLRAARSLARE